MATTFPAPAPLAVMLRLAQAKASSRTRQALLVALVLSLAVHLAFTLWPADTATVADSVPLTATITQLPPPPKPVVVPQAKPAAKPKPRHPSPAVAAPSPVETPVEAPTAEAREATTSAKTEATAAPAETSEPAAQVLPGAVPDAKSLPPRIDLAYKVFWGARGFLIGDAVYRFEHQGQRYRIATIGEARGLAALVLRGQGKIESRGLITSEGLQPMLMRVERGGPDRVETAVFDWEAGIVTMHDNKTAPLELPTFDPLALMWQYYFTPPASNEVTVTIATPRRLAKYTITREATETIEWANGTIEAERWHRRSEDGRTDAYIWLAPSLRYIPVKIRVSNTSRGTVEVLLDSIRVDEDAAAVGRDDLVMPRVDPAEYGPAADSPLAPPKPAETFPQMTGQ
jgi:hypothetical protein